MATSLSIGVSNTRENGVVTLSGAPPDTAVIFNIQHPTGVQEIEATTSPSGAATVSFVPAELGTYTATVTESQVAVIAGPATAVIDA
jgi:hypothetical protein